MSNPKALINEIRRLADAVGKVRADNGKTSGALDRLASALDEWRDEVVEAERVLGEVGDLNGELHGGGAWRPAWSKDGRAEQPDGWISGEPSRHDEGAVWWVIAPGLRAPVRAHWYHEWLIPGTPCCVDAPITAHAAYTTGKLPPPLPAKVKS